MVSAMLAFILREMMSSERCELQELHGLSTLF